MAARPTWQGAVDVQFDNSPLAIPVPVAVYTMVKSRRGESFKMLDPELKQPVKQQLVSANGTVVERSTTLKGVDAGGGQYVAIEGDALTLVENVGRSTKVAIERLAPVESIDFGMTIEQYAVVPDPKVPDAEAAVQVLWNGLMATGRAAVIENWAPRANSKPSTLVITANEHGLLGSLIAYARERNDYPAFTPDVRENIGEMFEKATKKYNREDFDPEVYTDTHAVRRQQAIDLALSGAPLDSVAVETVAAPSTPNLLAALEASLAAQTAEPAQPAKRSRKTKEEVKA